MIFRKGGHFWVILMIDLMKKASSKKMTRVYKIKKEGKMPKMCKRFDHVLPSYKFLDTYL